MDAIRRASLVESVTNALKDYINSDAVALGQKMPSEAALCEKFDVSRTTLREALRMLQATGYVELLPNRGAFVANKGTLTQTDAGSWMLTHAPEMLEVLEVRMVLEPFAAKLAAQNGSPTETYAIKGLGAMFEVVAQQENLSAMVAYDEKFHEAIMGASHNEFLMDIGRLMTKALRGYRGRTFAIDKDGSLAIGPHNVIAEAIMQRDPERAESIMREHMECNLNILRRYAAKSKGED